jgi:glycosyltransferase involved in cell wall biosynthesis
MKVLHLIDHMGLGGEQRILLDLLEAHAPDLEHTVWSLRQRDLPGVPQRMVAARVPYRAFGLTRHPLRALGLRSLIWRLRPDIVHLHLEYSTLIGAAVALSLATPQPVLVASVANDPHRQALIHRYAGRLLAPRMDLHIVNSQGIREATLRAYAGRPRRVETVMPGVDLRRVDRSHVDPRAVAQYRGGAGRVIGTVARLAEQKAIHVLLNATPLLLQQFPDTRVLVVGDGPLRPALEQQARRLGISSAVTLAGYQEDVASAYAAMDVFVLPSRDEGYGIVFLEAMAMGVPVVGTRVIGSTEAVEDGVTGLLVPYADAPALAQAVLRILGDPELRQHLRSTAAERVRRSFSREQSVAKVEALYRELARNRQVAAKG